MEDCLIKFIGVPDRENEKKEIWQLLLACDRDFIPPLSQRVSSTQKKWNKELRSDFSEGPREYFDELMGQQFLILRKNQKLIGFLTFKHHEDSVEVPGCLVTNYITTLCIDPAYRGMGLAEQLYSFMEQKLPKEMEAPCLSLRTWSTNYAQLHLLKKRGYVSYKRLLNDRGKGIDTIYFYKIINSHMD